MVSDVQVLSGTTTNWLCIRHPLGEAEDPFEPWGPEQDVNSTRLMTRVLHEEKPDFVYVTRSSRSKWRPGYPFQIRVLNGDLITGESKQAFG